MDEVKDLDESIGQIISGLNSFVPSGKTNTRINVKYYEGKSGAKSVYMDAFAAKELRTYVNLHETHKVFPENGKLYVDAQVKSPGNLTKEIIDDNLASIDKAQRYADNYNFKFKVSNIPTNLSSINILIFDEKVAMINFKDPIVASVLENRDYYQNSVAIFEFLWNTL